MTLNGLINRTMEISRMLSFGDIPLKLNGEPIEIVDITLEGENGNYWADIKAVARKEE